MTHVPRFGVPELLIADVARRQPGGVMRCGLYVPTEHEVLTLPLDRLRPMLLEWLWESPSELIPSDEQAAALMRVLAARHDAPTASSLIAEVAEYIAA